MLGGAGNDVLNGGAGTDRLTGGSGKDVFVFPDASRDTIIDFQHGVDKIDLGWWVSDMAAAAFHFLGAGSFQHHAGDARFSNGLFQLDVNGDGQADLSIALTGTLTASDFVFAPTDIGIIDRRRCTMSIRSNIAWLALGSVLVSGAA